MYPISCGIELISGITIDNLRATHVIVLNATHEHGSSI